MAIKSTGSLKFTDIEAEFGVNSGYRGLNRYYRGGSRVPSGPAQNSKIPTSGLNKFSNYYGAVKAFKADIVISSNTSDINLKFLLASYGWDWALPVDVTVTINSGVHVYGSSDGIFAFNTADDFPTGSSILITNNGIIRGAPGVATNIWSNGTGGPGGPALRLASTGLAFINNGTIVGGGGAGGVGGGQHSPSSDAVHNARPAGQGGTAIFAYAPTTFTNNGLIGGGGGGGGGGQWVGYTYALGGSGGGGAGYGAGGRPASEGSYGGNPGSDGALLTGGAGGAGTTAGNFGDTYTGETGGRGGDLGQAGTGASGGNGPGWAVYGNNYITWLNTGDRRGAIG